MGCRTRCRCDAGKAAGGGKIGGGSGTLRFGALMWSRPALDCTGEGCILGRGDMVRSGRWVAAEFADNQGHMAEEKATCIEEVHWWMVHGAFDRGE